MGKKSSSKSNYIMQGSILAIASIVSRIIGLLYRLPVTNIITDHGNDYYSAAYEIYNVILLISSYSLPLAVSKVVSAKVALGEYRNSWRAFKGALYMALVVGAAGSALTFFGAGFFTGTLLNTPESELCLKMTLHTAPTGGHLPRPTKSFSPSSPAITSRITKTPEPARNLLTCTSGC